MHDGYLPFLDFSGQPVLCIRDRTINRRRGGFGRPSDAMEVRCTERVNAYIHAQGSSVAETCVWSQGYGKVPVSFVDCRSLGYPPRTDVSPLVSQLGRSAATQQVGTKAQPEENALWRHDQRPAEGIRYNESQHPRLFVLGRGTPHEIYCQPQGGRYCVLPKVVRRPPGKGRREGRDCRCCV